MKDFRIVVIQAGWVLAGEYSAANGIVTLNKSSVIQRWGTTEGLGELCLSGPTKESTITPCGIAEIPQSAVLFTLAVGPAIAAKWPR
jgi:hypothetical protein